MSCRKAPAPVRSRAAGDRSRKTIIAPPGPLMTPRSSVGYWSEKDRLTGEAIQDGYDQSAAEWTLFGAG